MFKNVRGEIGVASHELTQTLPHLDVDSADEAELNFLASLIRYSSEGISWLSVNRCDCWRRRGGEVSLSSLPHIIKFVPVSIIPNSISLSVLFFFSRPNHVSNLISGE